MGKEGDHITKLIPELTQFSPEDSGNSFLRNVGILHGVTTKETTI
jgi:hypothetical protein